MMSVTNDDADQVSGRMYWPRRERAQDQLRVERLHRNHTATTSTYPVWRWNGSMGRARKKANCGDDYYYQPFYTYIHT